MKIELVTRRNDLAGIASDWDALAACHSRDGFFRTPSWYGAWMKHIRPDAEPFIITVRDAGGSIVGLAPLCRLKYRDLGFHITALAFGGREVVSGDFLDFLAVPEQRPAVLSSMLEFLWDARSDWGLLVLGELTNNSDSLAAVEAAAQRHGCAIRLQEERTCPYIALPRSFDEYLDTLGSSSRYHIRRRIRDVEKKGAHVEIHSEPVAVVKHLDAMVEMHLARWRKDNLPGTFGRPGFVSFLREVCTDPPAGSSSRLYMLMCNGAPAAGLLAFHFGESVLYYQAGWDPGSPVASLSPGAVVMAASVRDAIESGFRYYEFLRGDEDYKSRWTKTYRTTTTVLVGRKFFAREYLRVARLKDLVKHTISNEGPTAPSVAALPGAEDAAG
jgi:CelD/BcsL family acetyltransferase involved in cellulose biosynthesis